MDEQITWLARCLCADGGESADAVAAIGARLRRRFDVFQAHRLAKAIIGKVRMVDPGESRGGR